ncbi:hypothetical protein CDD81_2600 [Ophiocordyceps australis]|uniref:Anaphase-promoting complex subunit 4 WD40 domain-containing protein n=1 Tax=Ophiocordyceps australis TaxID=1399860 RepID=A0A2C5XXS9_9HYPO|nr:hypothetical protein CDD81_2600 [Ophiocordyceps australis]
MAPVLRPRQSLPKDRFSTHFLNIKSQAYADPGSTRGVNSTQSIRCMAWNPLGTLVATGSIDKTLRVWNPEKPHVKFSTELKGHGASVEKVAFNPTKDAELCSVSGDGVVKFWDVRTKACFNEVKGLGEALSLVWAPDGQTLLVGNRDDVLFMLSPTQPRPLAEHGQLVQTNQVAFCWGGDKVFAATSEGRTRILSYPGLEPVLSYIYSGQDEAAGEDEGQEDVSMADQVNGHERVGPGREFELHGHTSSCLAVEMQPTARYVATGGSDSIISLWDLTDLICQRTISGLAGAVKTISFTFDGSYVVGGSDEGNGLDVWHVETGEHVHTFKTAGSCPVVAWAPNRYWLAYSDLGVLRIVGVGGDGERK